MFQFYNNMRYQMPVLFGGFEFDPNEGAAALDLSIITFMQETTKEALDDYLPEGFSLVSPTLIVQYLQLREVDILSGGAYNIVQASLPVHFEGQNDSLDGVLPLVLWENDTIPILGGREYSGMPKIYTDISDLNCTDGHYFANASFNGNTFFTFDLENLRPCTDQEFSSMKSSYANVNAIGIRYTPKIGAPGADLIQTIVYPQTIIPYEIYTGTGSIEWTMLPFYQGLVHSRIIEQLSHIPCISMSAPTFTKGMITMKSLRCREIY
ncbi:acetoacetate decarboxylase [Lachnospiraceae bacterium KM106-2]|nr:acetoacetate decarboxylase [Lachnospiraceae bacterium KM106-2]